MSGNMWPSCVSSLNLRVVQESGYLSAHLPFSHRGWLLTRCSGNSHGPQTGKGGSTFLSPIPLWFRKQFVDEGVSAPAAVPAGPSLIL